MTVEAEPAEDAVRLDNLMAKLAEAAAESRDPDPDVAHLQDTRDHLAARGQWELADAQHTLLGMLRTPQQPTTPSPGLQLVPQPRRLDKEITP